MGLLAPPLSHPFPHQDTTTKPKLNEAMSKKIYKWRNRKFVSARNADEAEGELPTIEKLSFSNPREILNTGTLQQKMKVLISSEDLEGYFDAEEEISPNDKIRTISSLQTKEERDFAKACIMEYRTLQKYGERLRFFFKRFQTSFSILAVLLNEWDSYEREARNLSTIYNKIKSDEGEELAKNFATAMVNSIAEQGFKGAALRLDFTRVEPIFVDVDLKGREPKEDVAGLRRDYKDGRSLYSMIMEEAQVTKETLSDFKAFAVVAEEYIKKSKIKYMPISIQMSIENAEQERYTRYLVRNLHYFRSYLNERIHKKEAITAEDEKRAVIPDYYEVEPTPSVYENCKDGIRTLSGLS